MDEKAAPEELPNHRKILESATVVIGISYSLRDGRPIVVGVRGSGTVADPSLDVLFTHEGHKNDDRAATLLAVADKVESVLGQLPTPSVVVIHSMDMPSRARTRNVILWSSVEGALLAVARRYGRTVEALSGKQIADRLGSDKAGVERRAAQLVGEAAKRAGAAGLAGLHEAPG